jgi:3-deoxy-manno-octulosonate cytidylyltransferase (CMP-KDO synthetase)
LKKALGVIPVRYGATRFPGKALASILGKPMLQWVYEGAQRAELLSDVLIATDDERILKVAAEIGAKALMTSRCHSSGTERVAEVAESARVSIVVNIQGDEPLITGEIIDSLVLSLQDKAIPMATLMAKNKDISSLIDPHIVKVIVDKNSQALYFSRSPIPHGASDFFFQHIGIYGFQKDFLLNFRSMARSRLEKIENLEQLRAIENGFRIKMVEIPFPSLSVDTPQDIIKVEERLKNRDHE